MNIYYDNKLLLALYSYLRQTELSIELGEICHILQKH